MNAPRNRSSSSSSCAKTSADPVSEARALAWTTDDASAAFAHFRPLAERVPTDGLAVFTGQPMVMFANVHAAIALVEPHFALVVEQLRAPRFVEVFELPSLVLALQVAAARVPARALSTGEVDAMLSEASPLRELTLGYLEIAAHPLLSLVPTERVRAIREGSGKLDFAKDCLAISNLFAEYASSLSGRHPFSAETLRRLDALGSALIQQIKPGNAIATVPTRTPESILRDQLGAMVRDRYEHLLLMASAALGRSKAEALLPSLHSTAAPSPPKASDDKPAAKPDTPAANDKPVAKSDAPVANDKPAANDKPVAKPATDKPATDEPAPSKT